MRTVGQWVEWAASRFEDANLHFGHGTDNSQDEAAWLVLHAIGAPLDGSFRSWDQAVDERHSGAIDELVTRRITERCPAAYLTGVAWFAGLDFEVTADVLVPRSPIAELIEDEFAPWVSAGALGSVLDLCTGCGCIAIACAKRLPEARVTATDISEKALEVARRNVLRHGVEGQVKLIRSDLFGSLGAGKYDVIVTNPPYVSENSLRSLPAEYQAEPELGLRSGMDGLEIPLRILAHAEEFLEPDGLLICEVGESADALARALPRAPFLWLEFDSGGAGVFILQRSQVADTAPAARKLIGTT